MAFNTKLDLYDGKAIQCSNQTLTLSGKTVIATSGDLRYQTHPTFTGNTQIVDKCYVDTASGGISGSNGLCRCGNNITLGGALTGATTITFPNTPATSLLFTDSRTAPIGIQYGGDYCSAFQVRSLVDAGYVTGKTSQANCAISIAPKGVTGATNGICKYDCHNVCLTSINQTILTDAVTGATNLGSGNGTIYTTITDRKLQLKTLSGGTNITLTCNGNYIGINTPTVSVPVTGAANGLCVCGKIATLGGALTGNTCISGAYEFDLNVNKVNITGATGGVNLGGGLSLKTAPTGTGGLLCIDPVSGLVCQTSLSAFGGITGATNGIGTSGQKVCLGGALIAGTSITGAQALCLGTSASKLATLDLRPAGALTIVAGSLLMSASGATYTDLCAVTKQGIKYASDYSLTYDLRSLVDKGYVDSIATGLNIHAAVIVATTVPIILTANQTIDGILTTTGMRVLVKNQAAGQDNGIYLANSGAWTRSSDYTGSTQITNGDLIPVTSGSTQNSSIWALVTPEPITVGVTPLNYTEFSTVVDVQAGAGIAISQVGGVHTVCVNLGTNSGLNTSSGLVIDSSIAGSGLTWSTNKLNINGALGGSASSIPVKFNAGNCLVLNCADINTALNAITGATNGLTKAGQQVKLGGTITGATALTLGSVGSPTLIITDSRIACSGIEYAADYSAGFTARSLVDKGYADACDTKWLGSATGFTCTCVSNCTITANNGLNKAGNNIRLGGSLTGDTTIDIACHTFNICGVVGLSLICITESSCAASTITLNSCACTSVCSCGTGGVDVIAGGTLSLSGAKGHVTAPVSGLTYTADYHTTFVNSSLVDKCYVDSQISTSAVTFTNGLTKVGKTVVLGGALTGDTTINLGGYILNISGSTTGNTSFTGNIELQTIPNVGVVTDSILVWNSVDKEIKIIGSGSVGDKNNVYNKTIISSNATGTTASTYVILVSGATSFRLPSAPLTGQAFKIKDAAGTALSTPIIVNAGSGKTIDGSQCALINTDFGALELVYGATNKWFSLAFVN